VTAVFAWIRGWYGAHPLHLLALLAAFALAGYAVGAVVNAGHWLGVAIWFAVALIGHDLLLFPLYSLADLSLRRLLPRTPGNPAGQPGAAKNADIRTARGVAPQLAPPVLNYVRIPAGLSLLLLAVWSPLILRLSSAAYLRASGLSTAPYLGRWLAVTGVLFTCSAACYALRLRRMSAQAQKPRTESHPDS
jgi:hypothetical protein